ncbi:MAG: hypothetical protein WBM28_09595, partial [Burkholderiales bacterium]
VTLPLTDLSAPTVIVPTPEADVVTGGTSSAPLSVTFTPPPEDIPAHPASRMAAALMPTQKTRPIACRFAFILSPSFRLTVQKGTLFPCLEAPCLNTAGGSNIPCRPKESSAHDAIQCGEKARFRVLTGMAMSLTVAPLSQGDCPY